MLALSGRMKGGYVVTGTLYVIHLARLRYFGVVMRQNMIPVNRYLSRLVHPYTWTCFTFRSREYLRKPANFLTSKLIEKRHNMAAKKESRLNGLLEP